MKIFSLVGEFCVFSNNPSGTAKCRWYYFKKLHCATSREFSGSIPGGVTGNFFRGTPDRTMCPEVDSASESVYQGFLLG